MTENPQPDNLDHPENHPSQPDSAQSQESLAAGESSPATDGVPGAGKSPAGAAPPVRKQKMVLIRYGKMGNIGFFINNIRDFPSEVTHVIVNTERGLELGEILLPQAAHKDGQCRIRVEKVEEFCQNSDKNYPLHRDGRIVRLATEADLNEQRHLDLNIRDILRQCEGFIQQNQLLMKLVDAEHLFGGDRIIFYFMAEGRVDFRQLVKQLAQHFQTRIEMRQIGARDEAKLVADFETCGRECCCKNFLKVLKPVNMRMAKLQKATLDPSKISGRCGRLKCCLRYEDDVYNDLVKKLPRRGVCVKLNDGFGEVLDTQIITQMIKLRLGDGKIATVHIDEIVDLNYQPSEEEIARLEHRTGRDRRDRDTHEERRPAPAPQAQPVQASPPPVADAEDTGFDTEGLDGAPEQQQGGVEPAVSQDDQQRKRKRKRKKRKGPRPDGGNAPAGGQSTGGGAPAGEGSANNQPGQPGQPDRPDRPGQPGQPGQSGQSGQQQEFRSPGRRNRRNRNRRPNRAPGNDRPDNGPNTNPESAGPPTE